MNKRESKQRGDTMKRLIVLLVAAVFCVTLFSPTVFAHKYDVEHSPYIQDIGDGGGWDDPVQSSPPRHITPITTYFTFWFQKQFGTIFFGFIIDTLVTMDTDINGPEDGNNTRTNTEPVTGY